MAESAEQVYERVVSLVGDGGRLPPPAIQDWETFPWEGVTGVQALQPPLSAEDARSGAGGKDCWRCDNPDTGVVWQNDRWSVRMPERPSGLPLVLFLMSREHMDFPDMDDDMAAEYGRLAARMARAIEALPNVGRVHVCRWGDGSEHLHTWFMARTARMPQTRGSFAAEWDDILPPGPEDVWRADIATVARALAEYDGEART